MNILPSKAEQYAHHAKRIATLLVWLKRALDAHRANAMKPENRRHLWHMADDLTHIEGLLIRLVFFLTGCDYADLVDLLNKEGNGHE